MTSSATTRESCAGGPSTEPPAKVRDGQEHPSRTATTVSWDDGRPIVTDGPFLESKESIGGYGVFEVADLDAAIEIAKGWPAPGHKVEIRPVVER